MPANSRRDLIRALKGLLSCLSLFSLRSALTPIPKYLRAFRLMLCSDVFLHANTNKKKIFRDSSGECNIFSVANVKDRY